MKSVCLLIAFLVCIGAARAQDTIEVNQKAGKDLFATYHVLKKNANIKVGLYTLINKKNLAIACGLYDNNKKAGIWRYFNNNGSPAQIFDHTGDSLKYEAPDDFNKVRYVFDKQTTNKDILTKPVRIGGKYFGYMPYMVLFSKSKRFEDVPFDKLHVIMELLISPGGRLADFTFHISGGEYGDSEDLSINLDAMNEDDKRFIPATVNGEPVSCRVFLLCKLINRNTLVLE